MRLSASPFRNQDLSVPARPLGAGKPGLHIVQFKDVITDAAWDAMREAGAEVDSYLPDFAFLVRMTPEQAAKLARNPLVRDVTRFRPEWKVSPGLLKGSGKAQLRVSTFAGQESAVAQGAQALGVRAAQAGPGVVQVEADRSQVLALAQDENVTFVDEVRPIRPTNDVARGLIRAQGDGSPWANGLTGAGQVVAVADTGLDTGNATTLHPDLRNRLQTAIAIGRTGDWSDPWGHGTHVAGSILGNGAASGGQFKGVAPDARLVMQSMNTAEGGLTLPSGGLPTLFSQANSYGARIHTNSWGVPVQYGGWVYDTLAQQVDQYTWSNKGFTVLFAAGNDGFYGINTVTTPATAKNAISVGASENLRPYDPWGDNPNDIAAFSSRGNTPDGRVKPDVVAPGTWILSTRSSLAPDGEFWANYNQYYGYMGGTSMATPITAGSSALVRQFYMTKKGITPSASLIKATLINGAQDMGYGWMSPEQGWGRIDLTTSLFPTDWRYNWFDNESTPIATGGVKTYTFHADAGQMLKFSLVWTDSPGAPLAAKELVNDLDLEVTAPDNTIYKGNCFSNNTASSACTGYDRLNNVENVYFAAPADGYYTVKVKGYNVPVGPQPFSLVASGAYLFNGPDSAPPTVSITAPANNSLVSGTVDVRASASDDKLLTKVEFYLDGALQSDDTTAPYTWNWDAAGTPGGTHALVAKAYDAVGKVTTSAPVTVAIDTQAPVVNITTPANNGAVRGTATVTANALDDIRVAKVEFYVDDGAQPAYTDTAAPYSWSWVTTGLPGGSTHTLRAKAYDSAGNVAASPDVTVVVDNQAPTVALTGLTANAVLKGTVEVGANAADNLGVAKVEFYVDGVVKSTATTAPYTWSWDTATATNAAHSVTARAYDQAGNVATTLPVAVTVDNAPPALTSMIPADGASLRGTVTVTAGVSDNRGVTRVEFYLDEAAQPAVVDTAAPYSWTWNTATAGNGSHRITVKAYDAAGNMVSRALTVTADNTAPTVSITAPANQAALPAGTVTVTADAADNAGVAKVDFFLDGILKSTDTAAPFAWDWNTAGVIAGSHTLKVAASDAAGNKTDSAPVAITLDNLRPAVSISSPSASANLRGAVTVKASATDNRGVTKVEFYLDGALQGTDETGPAPYTWDWDTTQAENGTHALAAKAYDAVGNVTATLAVSVKVDNEAPSVSINTPANGGAVRGTVNVTANAADNIGVTKVAFYLDNGAQPAYTDTAAPYSWSWGTTTLVTGSTHTVIARAYDASGNVAASGPVTVTVDNVLPNLTVTVPRTGNYVRGTVTVSATASDTVALDRVEFYVDSVKNESLTGGPFDWNWDTHGVADGSRSLMVKAYDTAGNVRIVTTSVTVDNTAPTVSIAAPGNGAPVKGTVAVNASASGAVKVEFYLDDQRVYTDTVSPWSWGWNTTAGANGAHTLKVIGYDAAGNSASATVEVTVSN